MLDSFTAVLYKLTAMLNTLALTDMRYGGGHTQPKRSMSKWAQVRCQVQYTLWEDL